MLAGYEHRFVPSSLGAAAPTLVLLHGTGGDENDLIPLGRMLVPDANLLSLRGNVLENGLPRFFRRIAEGVFDLKTLRPVRSSLTSLLKRQRRNMASTACA